MKRSSLWTRCRPMSLNPAAIARIRRDSSRSSPRLGTARCARSARRLNPRPSMADLLVDDPYTLAETVRLPLADEPEVGRMLDAARAAARAWAQSPIAERVALCLRAVEAMEADKEAIAADITRMMGKPLKQARGEVGGMAKRARYM